MNTNISDLCKVFKYDVITLCNSETWFLSESNMSLNTIIRYIFCCWELCGLNGSGVTAVEDASLPPPPPSDIGDLDPPSDRIFWDILNQFNIHTYKEKSKR